MVERDHAAKGHIQCQYSCPFEKCADDASVGTETRRNEVLVLPLWLGKGKKIDGLQEEGPVTR